MPSFERGLAVFNAFVHKYGRLPTELDPDYLEMLRMSKYRILAMPDLKPGTCANCGSAKCDGRQYIDFGLLIDWFGTVYLCGFCLKDIATQMGLFQPLINEIGELRHKLLNIQILEAQGERLREDILHTFKEVKDYYETQLLLTSNSRDSNGSTSMDSNQESIESKSGNVESERPPEEPESRIVKPNSGKRSSNVRSLAELLEADTE